jgi:hypothetical protein
MSPGAIADSGAPPISLPPRLLFPLPRQYRLACNTVELTVAAAVASNTATNRPRSPVAPG